MDTGSKGQPIARIIARKKYHCPHCKALMPEEAAAASIIQCPSCGANVKIPGAPVENIQAPNERREVRCPVALMVKYNTANEFRVDYTKNVSRGGMFIRTDQPPPIGARLELQLHLPELNEPVMLLVEVVHSRAYDADPKEAGVGVKFMDIDPISRGILINYLTGLADCV